MFFELVELIGPELFEFETYPELVFEAPLEVLFDVVQEEDCDECFIDDFPSRVLNCVAVGVAVGIL